MLTDSTGFFLVSQGDFLKDTTRRHTASQPNIHEVLCVYIFFSVVGRLIVVNGSLLSLHTKQSFLLKELICFVSW